MARNPDKLNDVPWREQVEVVHGDLTEPDSLTAAFDGADVVYYLVHSMGTSADFVAEEARSAHNVVAAARQAGVRRLIYLSGLHPAGVQLSRHLASRTEVGEILIGSGIETVVLQAGVVIGSGSASFEMIRHLTERLPVMTTPKWVHNRVQPIAVRDVLYYLAEAATAAVPCSRTWDVGGPDVLEYGDMMQIYAQVAGLHRRRMLVLPFLTPTVASWWVGLVTPIPSGLARPLVESLECDAVMADHDVDTVIPPPDGGTTPYRRSVELALDHIEQGRFEPTWSAPSPASPLPGDPSWAGEVVVSDSVSGSSSRDPQAVWEALTRSGRRWERRDGTPGSAARLTDRSVPGDAWLEVEVSVRPDGGTDYTQTLRLCPRGLAGQLYAATVWPVRRRLLQRRAAQQASAQRS